MISCSVREEIEEDEGWVMEEADEKNMHKGWEGDDWSKDNEKILHYNSIVNQETNVLVYGISGGNNFFK